MIRWITILNAWTELEIFIHSLSLSLTVAITIVVTGIHEIFQWFYSHLLLFSGPSNSLPVPSILLIVFVADYQIWWTWVPLTLFEMGISSFLHAIAFEIA